MELARELQQKSVNMISLLGKYGGIATGKAYMKYIGINCGEYRSPVKNLADSMYDTFVKDVRALAMDDLFSVK
jgi:N-acetylneuraminate lyase